MSVKVNEAPVAKTNGARRSQRVCISVAILVTVHRANEKSQSEQTSTLVVNAHGALIALRIAVKLGDLLNLRNIKTHEEQSCRVVDLSGITPAGVPEVGVEFLVPAKNFWHIAFPPADWSPRGPQSKSAQPPAAAKPELMRKT
jgi:hypothetical protein